MTSEQATTPAYAQQGVQLSATKKALAYRNNQYVIYQTPQVTTARWSEQDWIHYIDQNGHWTI